MDFETELCLERSPPQVRVRSSKSMVAIMTLTTIKIVIHYVLVLRPWWLYRGMRMRTHGTLPREGTDARKPTVVP